jgi:hypothetical protein
LLQERDDDALPSRDKIIESILESVRLPALLQSDGPRGLCVRHLPPGRLADLYAQYVSYMAPRDNKAASVSTFRRCWRQDWDKALKTRKSSTHSMCITCSKLKGVMKHARSMTEHLGAVDRLLGHLESQWRDREKYWHLRARAVQEGDCLCVILDAMDKSKFLMPRWMHGKCPKSSVTDSLRRPNLELAAVIVHGHGVFVFIGDEDLRTGGNFHAEILMRALDHTFKACSKNGKVWPADLSVHADNTVAAAKNITVSSVCACLTAGGYFRCCGHQHLRVGHSHEDVGAPKKYTII